MRRSAFIGIVAFMLACAAFNAANALFYYTSFAVAVGILLILAGVAAFSLMYAKDASPHASKRASDRSLKRAGMLLFLAGGLAELVVIVPDLAFEFVKTLVITQNAAEGIAILFIAFAVFALAYNKPHNSWRGTCKGAMNYASLVLVLLGFLTLYSVMFSSLNGYLNAQNFIGALIFLNEGVLLFFVLLALMGSCA